jgi:hypothetical protein
MFHEALSPYGLSLLVANKHNVAALTGRRPRGRLKPTLPRLCSACDPAFGELLKAADAAGVHTIGQPAKARPSGPYKARGASEARRRGLARPADL